MFGDNGQARGFWLTLAMGRAAGADLAGAVVQGWLTRGELADMVDRREGCALGEACTDWLSRPAAGPAAPPVWCPNAAAIAALAPQRRA